MCGDPYRDTPFATARLVTPKPPRTPAQHRVKGAGKHAGLYWPQEVPSRAVCGCADNWPYRPICARHYPRAYAHLDAKHREFGRTITTPTDREMF